MAAKHRPGRKNRPSKSNYNSTARWKTNKLRKLRRHMKKYPNDAQSSAVLEKLS